MRGAHKGNTHTKINKQTEQKTKQNNAPPPHNNRRGKTNNFLPIQPKAHYFPGVAPNVL